MVQRALDSSVRSWPDAGRLVAVAGLLKSLISVSGPRILALVRRQRPAAMGYHEQFLISHPKTCASQYLNWRSWLLSAVSNQRRIGIPHRVVVGDRGITAGKLEYRHRRAEAAEEFPLADAIGFIRGRLAATPG